jgi:polygalacturonase
MKKNSFVLLLILSTINCYTQQTNWHKTQKKYLNHLADSISKNLKPWKVSKRIFKVDDYGVVGDSSTLNTVAIQIIIDKCSEAGGGVVYFQKGNM